VLDLPLPGSGVCIEVIRKSGDLLVECRGQVAGCVCCAGVVVSLLALSELFSDFAVQIITQNELIHIIARRVIVL
jgi:hypothetical protein